MVELIFVIVILGIIASLGSEMIAKVYQNYILQRAQHRASLKTELAATQIANRLRYAIPGTVYRIRTNNNYETIESDFPPGITGDDYKGLQWVAYDGDSFETIDPSSSTGRLPGWSGFCDINISGEQNISTPGSSLTFANTVIGNLSYTTKTIADAAIYFPYDNKEHNISSASGENINLENNASRIIEHYKLAWTSYALVVENGDLYLYYNFTPSPAILYTSGTKSLLLKNVNTFKFKASGRTVRFKVCKDEKISDDFNITACKEKAVF